MDAAEFVYWVNQNAARITEYSNGGDGSDGKCDCIGLVIGAWRLSGNKWPWTHGSNYCARYLTDKLGYDQSLHLGDLVYKARKPGESGYSLPDRYMDSGDLLDYYHVGVVTQESPLQITHCTSVQGGIKRDSKRGAWHYSGQFSKVDYEEVEPVGDIMVVWSENGKPVNLRNSYSTAASIIKQVPCGATVEVLKYVTDKWAMVRYGEHVGYMMTEFLREPDASNTDKAAKAVALLEQAVELQRQAIEMLKG